MSTSTAAPAGGSRRRFGRGNVVAPASRAGHAPTIGMRIHGAARKLAGRLTGSRSKVISGDSELTHNPAERKAKYAHSPNRDEDR